MLKRLGTIKKRDIVTDPDVVARECVESQGRPMFNELLDVYPEYDVVIVGGGTAGCVLASRLSEDPQNRVLLLEAGESGANQLYSRIPVASSRLFETDVDWAVHTEPQEYADHRRLYWPRAKMLGGCSSINALIFHYGSPSDFDEWAMIADSEEWGWLEFQDYFMKFEGFTQNRSYRSKQAARGIAGPVQTGFAGHYSEFAKLFTKACARAGIPRKHDFNTSEGTLGTGKTMTFIDGAGKRSSTETAYLTHEVLARPNLSVLTGAHVTRILLQRGIMDGQKRVSGVEFAHGPERRRYRVRALREVVLSAGAVHTPHILMLSGIGPEEHLREVGVPVLHNLQGVGQHLLDHPSVNLRFRTTSDSSLNKMTGATGWKQIYALPSLAEWALFGTGKMLCTIAESVSFVRSTDPRLFPKHIYPDQVEDATSGTYAPDLELYASPLAWWNHGRPTTQLTPESKEGLCSMSAILLRPTSTGEILLRSADPFDAPLVNPNYLSTKHDVDVMRRGLRFLLRLGLTQPLAGVIVRTEPCPSLDQALHGCTDAELDAVIRQRIETLYHPTSSCRMAGLNQNGVVDARLQVHGIEGLRVCDASAFPTITSGHTAAPVIAMAEKCADMMRKALYQTDSRQRS